MAVNDKRNVAGVVSKGSGRAWYRTCNSAGGSPGTWYSLGIVKESTFKDSSTTDTREDEGGNKYNSSGAREVSLTLTSLQRDVNMLDLYSDLRNGYCQVLKEQSAETVNGSYEYVLLGIAQLEDNLEIKLPGGEPQLKFNGVINSTSLSVGLGTISGAAVAGASLGTQTVATNAYYSYFGV